MSGEEGLLLQQIFAGTLSPDKVVREQAEAALAQISTDPHLIIRLIHFATQEIPQNVQTGETTTITHQVQQAAAIRVRNVLGRSDWNRQSYFTSDVKDAVRECIVPLQCEPHVPESIRRQLLATTQELINYDYPQRWPTLMPQLMKILDECVNGLRGVADSYSQSKESLTIRLKGALGVLYASCKAYDNPVMVDADVIDDFVENLFPSLFSLTELLLQAWTQELIQQQQQQQQQQAVSTNMSESQMFTISVWHNDLSHCLRLTFKCFYILTASRWPRFLCEPTTMERFCQSCLGQLLDITHSTLLPLYRQRIPSNDVDDSDLFSAFHESPTWKLLKWAENLSLRLLQELMSPKSCERRARAAAKYYCDHHMLRFAEQALEFVRWHATSRCVTSPAYILALEVLTVGVNARTLYTSLITPNAGELFTNLIFPRLAFTAAEAETWALNPAEYVRQQTNPCGDVYSAKLGAASLMIALVVPSKSFHDNTLLTHVLQFVMEQLTRHTEAAVQGVVESARVMDAALFAMYQLSKVMYEVNVSDEMIESIIVRHIAPVSKSPVGFLRARSVLLLSVFAPKIKWSNCESFQRVLSDILPLLNDTEVPVQMQTCMSLSPLICHPYARDVVTPCISNIIQHYFNAMRLMDNEGVVRTLRKTIKHYRDSLSQWALQLTEMLVQHFEQVLQRTIAAEHEDAVVQALDNNNNKSKGGLLDGCDGDIADSIMAADEVLETLTTLVRALPHHSAASEAALQESNLLLQIQERIAPMLFAIMSEEGGSTLGFMDAALMLLTTVLSHSSAVASPTWRLLLCLHRLVVQGAVDYFSLMLPPLDNFVCVSPAVFLFSPMNTICDVPPFAVSLASMTPAQVVCTMCDAVLNNSNALRLRELSGVPKMYDSILQNMWKLKQEQESPCIEGIPIEVINRLIDHIIRSALLVLGDASTQEKGRRTFAVLFVNTILSAILADAACTVSTLSAAGALSPLFAQYVQLVQGEAMQSMLRSYDRRLFLLAIGSLVMLWLKQPEAAAGVEEVLRGVLLSNILAKYTECEAVMLAVEIEKHAEGEHSNNDEDDEDDDEDSCSDDSAWGAGNDEDDEIELDDDDDNDIDDMDEDCGDNNNNNSTEMGSADSAHLHSLIKAVAVARAKGGIGIVNSGEEEEEEGNLLDEDDFLSPIDTCNAWTVLMGIIQCVEQTANINGGGGNTISTSPAVELFKLLKETHVEEQLSGMRQFGELTGHFPSRNDGE
ncbi:importin-7 [Trypanosoma theileri]|uniref:Importin-7 n=1 Tax=Trypanosoma theileri TaxID=67003 RepID=A0A1X0NN60_9TRYP|nr:importin-7 [Trypanosoma theileri]ORC86144.1 importin-7 [Trypanosoma theileri]